jgi:SPP1 gp7 family putative phage head morphogenesis protein
MLRLSREDCVRLKNSADVAQRIEDRWVRKFEDAISSAAARSVEPLSVGKNPVVPDFEDLLIRHYFETQIAALTLAEKERELDRRQRLSAKPKTLSEIMRLYDRWKKKYWKPKSVAKKAERIRRQYLDAVQRTWKKYSRPFREGEEFTQEEVKAKIQEAAKAPAARAGTIVRTETTRYYNDARKAYYDASTDVTHYLFIAIRDKATTKWCTASTTGGKRGRSGLVYSKDDPLLQKEKPPCHWNCRSELLPLVPQNPSHRKIIEDSSRARRSHSCYPLPVGWNQ